jgi:hypothetical protein
MKGKSFSVHTVLQVLRLCEHLRVQLYWNGWYPPELTLTARALQKETTAFANINSNVAVKIEIEFSSWTLERREVIGVGYSTLKKVILREFSYVRIYAGRVRYTHWQIKVRPTRCNWQWFIDNKLFLNMFRVSLRPSSGEQTASHCPWCSVLTVVVVFPESRVVRCVHCEKDVALLPINHH